MIRELFAVGLGGAAGSIVRYMLSVWLLGGHTLLGFPAGTFTVNAAGSLLIGILLETTNSAAAGWLLIAGFCGRSSPPFRPFRPMPCGCCVPETTGLRRPTLR